MLSEVSPDQAQVAGSTPFDIGLQKWSSGYSMEVQQAEQQSVSGRTHSDQGSAVRGWASEMDSKQYGEWSGKASASPSPVAFLSRPTSSNLSPLKFPSGFADGAGSAAGADGWNESAGLSPFKTSVGDRALTPIITGMQWMPAGDRARTPMTPDVAYEPDVDHISESPTTSKVGSAWSDANDFASQQWGVSRPMSPDLQQRGTSRPMSPEAVIAGAGAGYGANAVAGASPFSVWTPSGVSPLGIASAEGTASVAPSPFQDRLAPVPFADGASPGSGPFWSPLAESAPSQPSWMPTGVFPDDYFAMMERAETPASAFSDCASAVFSQSPDGTRYSTQSKWMPADRRAEVEASLGMTQTDGFPMAVDDRA